MTERTSFSARPLNLAYPLDTFYNPVGRPLPKFERIPGVEMPEPYRQLLVGEHDMTPTLERFHAHPLGIQVLERVVDGDRYSRLVLLTLPGGRPVEFGAIVIYLDCLPDSGRAAVLEQQTPLGAVLARYSIVHSSCPQAFVRVQPDLLMHDVLHLTGDQPLYGRRNFLLTRDHRVLADILEILPPTQPVA
jgi:Tryptophanase